MKIKDTSLSSIILDIIIHTTLFLLVVVTLFPVLNVFSSSLSSADAIEKGLVTVYPVEFTLSSYKAIFKVGEVVNGFKNSVVYTVVGTLINLVMTGSLAYALSKKRLALRKFYTLIVVVTMFFSGGLIPNFILVRSLKMYNTIWALTIPGAISTWNLIIMRTFFQSIPEEIEESAVLDGANDIIIFARIIIPLSKAAIATIGLFYAVGHWNSWFSASIYLKDSKKYPLQLILRQIVIMSQVQDELASLNDPTITQRTNVEGIKYATLFVSIVPMLIIYPFIQKYFVKGVMIGSLKG